jgi:hypothetical protein
MRFFMTFIYLFIYINQKVYNNLWETTYSTRWKRGAKVENSGFGLYQSLNALLEQNRNDIDSYEQAGENYAQAERDYRKAREIETVKLKADKMPVTLIPDIAKGKVADEYYRSLSAESLVRASLERINLDKRQIDIMRETIKREYGGNV